MPDRLKHGLRVIFVGFNPSLTSHKTGFNYAGRNNRFYRILHEIGLTDHLYRPDESPQLIEHGYGFTNIVSRPTKAAAEIRADEYEQGRVVLRQTLSYYQPQIACYVGKGVYEQFAKRRGSDIPWGRQKQSCVDGVIDFVGPSSSGLVRMTLAEQVTIYQELADLLAEKKSLS